MAKIAQKYLEVHPWKIIENGFHPERSRVSESIFSLANEYMGVRGYFEEGYSGDKLVGSYINGVFEEKPIVHAALFKGFSTRFCFMANTLDWLSTKITIDGETLDLKKSKITHFKRVLDMKKGTLSREFIWETATKKKVKIVFLRFVSMVNSELGSQRVSITAMNFDGKVNVETGLDFSIIHEQEMKNFWDCQRVLEAENPAILAKTQNSKQQVFSTFSLSSNQKLNTTIEKREKYIGKTFVLDLKKGEAVSFDKMVVNFCSRFNNEKTENVWQKGMNTAKILENISFDAELEKHRLYWEKAWKNIDIEIEGDDESQQGVRFCIFNLHQTYHGKDPTLNIGAKGLTGEFYFGWTWWDTETYCLPFYLFSNPTAARSLLEYRYNTLPQAIERAKELDCKGACIPMGTIDGTESCGTWQHGNLEIHVSAAPSYGVWHYDKICDDKEFLYSKGIEILLQACRYFMSRGAYSQKTGEFGFYGVMGADEFHMMVNNNTYTNVMAKKTFEFALKTIGEMKKEAPKKLASLFSKFAITQEELDSFKDISMNIRVNFNEETMLFEQHDGYFDLPHTEIDKIPVTDYPVYKNWSYDRIFRTDMIKQPDVLLLMFFFSNEYSEEIKLANYEYYEERCSHESSLSPCVHSILAAELGKHEEAYKFSGFTSRLDLDDYNRNTHEGLHITSMAGTWLGIVYGFGGMRSDGDILSFKPSTCSVWNSYSFRILYKGSVIKVEVKKSSAIFTVLEGEPVKIKIYDKEYMIHKNNTIVKLEGKKR